MLETAGIPNGPPQLGTPSDKEFAERYGCSSKKSRWYFDQYLPAGIDRRARRVSPLFDRSLSDLPATR